MSENSLSAAIAGNLADQEAETAAPTPKAKPKRARPANQLGTKGKAKKAEPAKTVLVGGHFPPAVLKQLRIIAAEDDTTNQALIGEALDLLFVKKGRGRIDSL